MQIKENVKKIFSEIPKNVKVLAATKNQNPEKIKQAVNAGIRVIGENIVQDAEKKFSEFDFEVGKHFIGHLQSNKAKKAVELFDCIQSVDSLKLAGKIDSACSGINKKMPVFIELNLGENQKFGVKKEEILTIAEGISRMNFLELKGLMFIAPFFEQPEKSVPFFSEAGKVFFELKNSFASVEVLSMGMSTDFVFAVKNKSNMIRIGKKIFS
ncbi:YggS family pyridoxal phosphate-dependent enzyme [Candidatus Micrarchaeota archaeon]|nr:YggS family pyridoxal phosphate-dependent enzyme [Candidatus Micrarchaeota archaeon]MBU2476219.1 YggS family pyridoxal phosphate-dependent enzyme [Candidatus Micrarchaeota archaeon]